MYRLMATAFRVVYGAQPVLQQDGPGDLVEPRREEHHHFGSRELPFCRQVVEASQPVQGSAAHNDADMHRLIHQL